MIYPVITKKYSGLLTDTSYKNSPDYVDGKYKGHKLTSNPVDMYKTLNNGVDDRTFMEKHGGKIGLGLTGAGLATGVGGLLAKNKKVAIAGGIGALAGLAPLAYSGVKINKKLNNLIRQRSQEAYGTDPGHIGGNAWETHNSRMKALRGGDAGSSEVTGNNKFGEMMLTPVLAANNNRRAKHQMAASIDLMEKLNKK